MKYCTKCGAQVDEQSNFCNVCGAQIAKSNQSTNSGNTTPPPINSVSQANDSGARRQEYIGNILKCPGCGAEVNSFTAICPECGHEFNSVKSSGAVADFIYSVNDCDIKIGSEPNTQKGWSSWTGGQRFWWVFLNIFTLCIPVIIKTALPLITINKAPNLSPAESVKNVLIKNFKCPNDRGSILEALQYCQSQILLIANAKLKDHDVYWAKVWDLKAKSIASQADILLKNDTVVPTLLNEIDSSNKLIQKKLKTKAIIFTVLMVILIAIIGNRQINLR